jgi:hypothetical protein
MNRAEEINLLHDKIWIAAKTTITEALRIGELLTEQKAECGHGNWLPWLEANIHFSQRTAHNYMSVYERRGELESETIANLTEAYRLLAGEVEPEEEDPAEGLPKGFDTIPEVQEQLRLIRETKRKEATARKRPPMRKVASKTIDVQATITRTEKVPLVPANAPGEALVDGSEHLETVPEDAPVGDSSLDKVVRLELLVGHLADLLTPARELISQLRLRSNASHARRSKLAHLGELVGDLWERLGLIAEEIKDLKEPL